MSNEFLDVLRQTAREKEIPLEELLETVESALVSAYKRDYANQGEIKVRLHADKGTFQVYCQKTVVEDPQDPLSEISVQEARKYDPDALPGQVIEIDITPRSYGRIAAQTARQVLTQRIREIERDRVYREFVERVGEVMTGIVQRREGRHVIVGLGKAEAVLPPTEQVPSEPYRPNDRLKVYIVEVRNTSKGPQVLVSRTHPTLIRRLFELEVPEITDGTVTIKSVAREPGARSKIAVYSRDERVDPVGACVGHRGSRVQSVVNELYDEKIDVVRWSEDPAQFIAEALSPAKVLKVTLNEENKSAFVVVADNQLSLAIGRSGQNVRLAARLTGWRIDIRSESQVAKAWQEEGAAIPTDLGAPSERMPVAAAPAGGLPPCDENVPDDSLPEIQADDLDTSRLQEHAEGIAPESGP